MSDKPFIDYYNWNLFPGIYVGFTSKKSKFKKELKRLGDYSALYKEQTFAGRCLQFESTKNGLTVIVFLKRKLFPKDLDINDLHGLIVHEASHVMDFIFQKIGESQPGSEVKAYVIQKLCVEMFCTLDRENKGK